MPRFQRTTVGRLRYDVDAAQVDYLEVECGGGGDCLFLSLAWALTRAGIPATADMLRATASATLVSWAPPNAVPDIVDTLHVAMPGLAAAQGLAATGEWGDLACIVAIVDQFCSNGSDVAVHVLGPTENDVLVVRSRRAVAVNPTAEVHIVFKSFMHFRALVPAGSDMRAISASRLVANYDTISADPPPVKKIQASLNRKRGHSDKGGLATSTVNTPAGASVEIHHINVGQGDSTLVFIKDAKGQIQRSILIDAGPSASAAEVRRYLDAQIAKGNFRPVDVLVLSHWDEDHIGGAPALLRFNSKVGSLASVGYFNEPLQIFDVGDDAIRDTHYDNYMKAIKELRLNEYRNVPDPGQVLVSCLGVTIRCIGRLEIGLYPLVGEFASAKKREKFKYSNVGADITPAYLLGDDDVVDLQSEPGAGSKNNASIALLLTFGEFTYFSAGDLEGDAEVLMVQYARVALGRHICAWKMSHHGSHASATSDFFYNAAPRFGVASCGTGNQHGHPGRAIQARVDQVNTLAGCACSYYVTQAVASDASQFAQPDGKTAFANQGDIVIRVTEPKNKAHVFEVHATGSQGEREYQCGDRSEQYPLIGNHSDLVKQRDPGRAAASTARRLKRKKLSEDTPRQWLYARVGEILGLETANTAEIDAELGRRRLDEEFSRVLAQLTGAYKIGAEDDSMNDAEIASDRAPIYASDRFAKSFLDRLRKSPK